MKTDDYSAVCSLLPEGWKEAARTTKALVRSRHIANAEELLRLIFVYQTNGGGYGLTAAYTQIAENQAPLSKTAVKKRIVNSGEWLRWMCEHLCRREGFLVEPPAWLKEYRVCMVDASNYSKKGSHSTDFRFHCMVELFTLTMAETYFTDSREGEKLSRYQTLQAGDLVVADRAYGTLAGVFYTMSRGADFVLRMKADSFALYTGDGERFDLTARLREWQPGHDLDLALFVKRGKELVPLRVCAVAKNSAQIEASRRQIKQSNTKGKRGMVTPLQAIWSRYVVVATSLPQEISAERVLEVYRMRWQIELVFKRFKSIFGGGSFSAKTEESVRAWFYGKLLLASLCETLAKVGRFSPLDTKEDAELRCRIFLALART